MNKPFEMLARFIQTLANNQVIELPYIMGARNIEWSERFFWGHDRECGECVMMGISHRRNGSVSHARDQACDWSLNGILQAIQEWTPEDIAGANLQLLDTKGSEILEAIVALDDAILNEKASEEEIKLWINGDYWVASYKNNMASISHHMSKEEKWSLDETVTAVINQTNSQN
jgi:hypothetical protein